MSIVPALRPKPPGELLTLAVMEARRLFAYFFRATGDHHEAQDLVQEVLLLAFRRDEKPVAHEEPRGFLWRAAQLVLWSARRKQRDDETDRESVDEANPALVVWPRLEAQLDARRALESLARDPRGALLVRRALGESIAELAAARSGTHQGTVTRLVNSRRVLRKEAMTDSQPPTVAKAA